MNRLPFTKYASKALNEGREIAGYLGFKDVSSIFILLDFTEQMDLLRAKFLRCME